MNYDKFNHSNTPTQYPNKNKIILKSNAKESCTCEHISVNIIPNYNLKDSCLTKLVKEVSQSTTYIWKFLTLLISFYVIFL